MAPNPQVSGYWCPRMLPPEALFNSGAVSASSLSKGQGAINPKASSRELNFDAQNIEPRVQWVSLKGAGPPLQENSTQPQGGAVDKVWERVNRHPLKARCQKSSEIVKI